MGDTKAQIGYFLFSLDTELALGHFDHFDPAMFSADGQRERRSIEQILEILDEFNITATWAVTGHMFYERCEECDLCPILDWKGKYSSFEQIYGTQNPLWYGADVIETLLTRGSRHEIAFHGYTHRAFDELSEDEARFEIQEWLRLAKRKNIVPQTVVFPRNRVDHLDIFKEAGFICYRGKKVMSKTYSIPLIGKALNRVDLFLQIMIPQVYELTVEPSGLVNLPSSQWFFRINRKVERIIDSLNLHTLRIRRMIQGVENAVNEKKIIHIWAHPFEFQTQKDFEKLCYLFAYVSEQVNRGGLQSVSMADLARIAIEQHGEVIY